MATSKAKKAQDGPPFLSSPVPALVRIATLLRHLDDEVAALKRENCPDRDLSVLAEVPDLEEVLGPLKKALTEAVQLLGVEPLPINVRRRTRGRLHILWADLIDMSAEQLGKQWGAHDVPEAWPELHRQLLAAVEQAIKDLGG